MKTAFFRLFTGMILASTLFMGGCAWRSLQTPLESYAAVVTMKTRTLRFSETAFVRRFPERLEIQVYSGGKLIHVFKVGESVCTEEGCLSAVNFNRRFLSDHYPPTLFPDIVRGNPINDMAGRTLNEPGEQRFYMPGRYDVTYRFSGRERFFRDRTNGFLFVMKEL